MNKPLVSVVLCFYNEEKFIAEAVESVIAQDYENWELILVDDGSKDDSTRIAKHYAEVYPHIFYYDHAGHANKGLSASRNAGIDQCKGEYVAFIDADDVWLKGKLTNQTNIFHQNKDITVLLEASEYWKEWTASKEKDTIVHVGVQENVYSPPQLMLSLYPLGNGSAPCPSGIMLKRKVLTKHRFEESFRGIYQMYEDQAFLCKIYLTEKIYVSSQCNNRYRQRPSSLVSAVHETGKYHVVRKFYLQWFQQYLRKQSGKSFLVRLALFRALMPYHEPRLHKVLFDYPIIMKRLVAKCLVKLGVIKYARA